MRLLGRLQLLLDLQGFLVQQLTYLLIFLFLLGLLLDNIHYAALECFFVSEQSVLLPGEIRALGIKAMSCYASVENPIDNSIVRVLFELQRSAVLHEFLELRGLSFAQFVQTGLQLLLLDIAIFLILGPTWQSLPRQTSLKEIQKDMTNRFKVISS